MKLWTAMQRIERYRYEVERIEALARDCSPEMRAVLDEVGRQWLDLAAQTQALFEAAKMPCVTPLSYKMPSIEAAASDREAA
jgi:hypothetical protein